MKWFLVILTLLFVTGCGSKSTKSQTNFFVVDETGNGSNKFLIDKAISPDHFLIYTNTRDELLRQTLVNSIKTWLEPLELISENINKNIHLMPFESNLADWKIFFHDYDFSEENNSPACTRDFLSLQDTQKCRRSYCYYKKKEIHIFLTDDLELDKKTIYHELGHAFGLDDTYTKDKKDFHPDSTMKSHHNSLDLFSRNRGRKEIKLDDIYGISYLFCRKFPSECNASSFKYHDLQATRKWLRNHHFFKLALYKITLAFSNEALKEKYLLGFANDLRNLKTWANDNSIHLDSDPFVSSLYQAINYSLEEWEQLEQCLEENDFYSWAKCQKAIIQSKSHEH